MKPHVHAELIKKWADGAEIEVKSHGDAWIPAGLPGWYPANEYRVKPAPDTVRYVLSGHFEECLMTDESMTNCMVMHDTTPTYPCIKLTFDGETGRLKDAEVIK